MGQAARHGTSARRGGRYAHQVFWGATRRPIARCPSQATHDEAARHRSRVQRGWGHRLLGLRVARARPGLRRPRGRRRLDGRHARGRARAPGAIVLQHPVQPRHRRRGAVRLPVRAEHGYQLAVQVDGDGQHDARYLPELLDHLRSDPSLDMVTGSRFLARDSDGYRSSRSRRFGIRIFAGSCRGIVGRRGDRPDVGLAHDRPPRHRALRPRLPARLSRGRGGAAVARPPARWATSCRCGCARARPASRRSTRAAPSTT